MGLRRRIEDSIHSVHFTFLVLSRSKQRISLELSIVGRPIGQGGKTLADDPSKPVAWQSIAFRFGLLTAILSALPIAALALPWWPEHVLVFTGSWTSLVLVLSVVLPTLGAISAATLLTKNINALRDTTEAAASGDFGSPIEINCTCEVGGLAQSVRKLVYQVNAYVQKINVAAHRDQLTRLPNREVIVHLIDALVSLRGEGAVLFVDLVGFRRVNQTFGYRAGDRLLGDVALRLSERGLLRKVERLEWCTDSFGRLEYRLPKDISFARFAADQFVALLPGKISSVECQHVAELMLRSLEDPFVVAGAELAMSARIGIVMLPDDRSSGAWEILQFAETAMRQAEFEQRKLMFFSPALRAAATKRSALERDLAFAIERNELVLHYQPQVDCVSEATVAVEALLRWKHPDLGLVSPAIFIPIAEQVGLMPAIGRVVLLSAIAQVATWKKVGTPRRVAINVSALQFEELDFAEQVLSIARKFGVDPGLIEIEITESVAMADVLHVRETMTKLRSTGMHLAIDDFGTGYSNLSQLARLPFTTLKIDRTLIGEETILGAILDMAQRLGYSVVAEGVEDVDQKERLKGLGCYIQQGFYFAKPMTVEEFEIWEHERAALILSKAHAKMVNRVEPKGLRKSA